MSSHHTARTIATHHDRASIDAQPCMCGAPRADHGGKRNTGRCETTSCHRYRADTDYLLAQRALDARDLAVADDARAYARRRASGAVVCGDGYCAEAADTHNPDGSDSIAEFIREALLTRRRALYPWRLVDYLVPTGRGYLIRVDDFDPVTGLLERIHVAFRPGNEDPPDQGHFDRLTLEAAALTVDGQPVETLRLREINPVTGGDRVHDQPYDPLAGEAALRSIPADPLGNIADPGRPQPQPCPSCPNHTPAADGGDQQQQGVGA